MNIGLIILLVALAAAVYLALDARARPFGIVGVVAAGVHVAIAFGWIALRIRGVNLGLVLAAGLVIAGAGAWMRIESKVHVTAATALAVIGLAKLVAYF